MQKLRMNLKRSFGESARDTLDKRLVHLPKEVKFCKKCVISNQRPNIEFDDEGICFPCRYGGNKSAIDWDARRKEFETLLDRYRSKDGSNDVVVPCSGGKDSGSIAHRLKYEYGMNPLAVTWSPMLYTFEGWRNLMNLIQSGIDHVLLSPNPLIYRKLALLQLVKTGAHFSAFSRGTMASPFHVAKERGIKLIMYAENGEAEYGGIRDYEHMTGVDRDDFDRFYFENVSLDEIVRVGLEEGYFLDEEIKPKTFKYFVPPSRQEFIDNSLAMCWFFYFNRNLPQENYYYCAEHTGFEANPGRSEGTYSKFASLDDKTDGFNYYFMFLKFGIGRTTSDAAHEVRDGRITRDEAVALVKRYDGEFPVKYFKEFLEFMSITEEDFYDIADAYRLDHIWKKEDGVWQLRYQVS